MTDAHAATVSNPKAVFRNKSQGDPIQLNIQLLSCHDVVAATRLSRATIYRMMAAGKFPKAIKAGFATRWRKSDVEAWLADLVADAA